MTHFKIVFIFLFAGMLLGFSSGTSQALPTTPSDYDWVNSACWSLTDRTTATGGEATFTLLFEVRNTGQIYYSDSRLNSSEEERANDHVRTAFNGHNSAFIYLEELPGLGDRDFQDMVIQGIDIAPAPAPVPEPATLFLLGVGLLGIAGIHRKRYTQK
jgi:hypothetical protein